MNSSSWADLYLAFAEAALDISDEASFRQVVETHLKPLLPHQKLVAVVGQLTFQQLTARYAITLNYPPELTMAVLAPVRIDERPVLQWWLHTRAPVVVSPEQYESLLSDRERQEAHALQLGRFAVYGLPDITRRMGTFFSFGDIDAGLEPSRLQRTLQLTVPHLHSALLRCEAMRTVQNLHHACPEPLSDIEVELLTWLAAGRTNDEMASLRNRSPATIRNQLNHLYRKLKVTNRAEAVAWQMSQSLHVPPPRRAD